MKPKQSAGPHDRLSQESSQRPDQSNQGSKSPYQKQSTLNQTRVTDTGLLSHEAENERLKTTVMVLN